MRNVVLDIHKPTERREFKELCNLSLEEKILLTKKLIQDFINYNHGKVNLSFSGGKDSTVLRDIALSVDEDIPVVFSNTGLEYPEIVTFVKCFPNVDIVKPEKSFYWVIKNEGYPVISKIISRGIRLLKENSETTPNIRNLYLTGNNRLGYKTKGFKIPTKWLYLINSPFKISEKCCFWLKKKPLLMYQKEHKTKRIMGMMYSDSPIRAMKLCNYGINSFDYSNPLAFWNEQDILRYIYDRNIPYCNIYGKIEKNNGKYTNTGVKRTGCMFCMFGCHLEKSPNRFEQMEYTHPQLYEYCMNKLGCKEVLDYCHITSTVRGEI